MSLALFIETIFRVSRWGIHKIHDLPNKTINIVFEPSYIYKICVGKKLVKDWLKFSDEVVIEQKLTRVGGGLNSKAIEVAGSTSVPKLGPI